MTNKIPEEYKDYAVGKLCPFLNIECTGKDSNCQLYVEKHTSIPKFVNGDVIKDKNGEFKIEKKIVDGFCAIKMQAELTLDVTLQVKAQTQLLSLLQQQTSAKVQPTIQLPR